MDKDKIKLNSNNTWFIKLFVVDGNYYVFVGADGPCSVSINIGGKIFRAHHDEVNKGLISAAVIDHKAMKDMHGKNMKSAKNAMKVFK